MTLEPHRFIEVLRLGARQAGATAHHLQGKVRPERKPSFESPESEALTAADLAAQDILLYLLHHFFPEVAVDTEEDTPTVHLFPPPSPQTPLVVVDPIDGTLNYTRGSPDYAVMAALLERDRFRASLIHFPSHDLTAWAIRGEGCYVERSGEPAQRVEIIRPPHRILVSPRVGRRWQRALGNFGDVQLSRCSAVDAAAPALDWAQASVSRDRADRRRAIGFLLTTEAGGYVQLGEHRWKGEDPDALPEHAAPTVSASRQDLAEGILEALRR